MPDLIDTDGRTVAVADENVANALSQGWRPATTGDTLKRADEVARHEAYGGVAGGAKALYYGALRGATLGLSDVGLRALGTSAGTLKGYQEENPGLSTAAELAGAFVPSFAAPESLLARTPAGAVSHIGRSIVDAAEAGGAGVLGKAAASTAGAAAEGALYGGGSYLSQTALEDKPLAAEGFLGAMGKGALWAAPVGGALSLGESALIRARSLFPRAEMTKQAARAVDRDATTAISQSMQDGQQMAEKARQQIALTEAKIGSSQATEQMTRSMFGAADDSALQNQVTGAAEHSELSHALKNYETSNAEFEDWIRAEADPDLERSLLRLRAPNVQDANAPKLNVPEWGEVVPPVVKDPLLGSFTGDFDPVTGVRRSAQGTPGPHEPPRMPITTDLPPLPLADKTSLFDSKDLDLNFDPKKRLYYYKDPGKVTAEEAEKFAPSEDLTGVRSRPDLPPIQGEAASAIAPVKASPLTDDKAAAPATDTLTGQMRSMQEQLAGGKSLKDLGAPSRAEYAAAKAEKSSAAAEHFRAKAVAKTAPAADDSLEALLRGTKEQLDTGKGMREIAGGSHSPARAAVAEVKATPAIEAKVAEAAPKGLPEIASGPKRATLNSIDDFESFFGKDWSKAAPEEWMAEAKAMGGQHFGGSRDVAKTIVDGSMKDAMRGVVEDDAIAAALRRHNGKNVDIGQDLAKAAKVIGDRESAMADLADLLGADAPVMATQNAKAFRAAMQEQAEKNGASAARAASDFDAKGGQQTLIDSDIAKALRAHDSKSEAGAQRATVSLTKGETKESAKEAAKPRGALSVAADVGTALEVLHAMGVHTPDLSAIPVIGPVLSLYLKARAVLGVMGRKGGSIGRSTEGVIAAKASAIRDRIAKAVPAMLDVGAKAARKAGPIAGPAGALAYRLFPGDGETKSKDPRVLYDARMSEIARAQQPGAIDQAVSDRVRTSDPELQNALTAQAQRAVDFLASKAPQKPLLLPMLPGDGKWHPSKTALEQWARYAAAVHDPAGVLEDLANGHVTSEGAETLRVVYPALYAEAQRRLLEHAVEYTKTLPYARRVSLSIMFRVPVDGSMSAQHVAYIAGPKPVPAGAGAPVGPAPGGGGAPALTAPLSIGQQTMTSVDRRAGM